MDGKWDTKGRKTVQLQDIRKARFKGKGRSHDRRPTKVNNQKHEKIST